MSRLQTSFVLGYHGCDKAVGLKAIAGDIDLIRSEKDFDWLGSGIYFWEGDPLRALEWAAEKAKRDPTIKEPFVIGAVIDLGNCLDLLVRENLELVLDAHDEFVQVQAKAGKVMPINTNLKGEPDPDGVLRNLDCAVLNYMFKRLEGPDNQEGIEPFDTVRAYFREGERLFAGSGFHRKNHSQIAVRNDACIKGLFQPRPPVSAPGSGA